MSDISRTPRNDHHRDHGAVLVWVAASMVVLIGMGALVIDIGALYWEKRQLQNGADAAALAVAQDCVEGDCQDEYATANDFVDRNAKDGASNVDTVCGNGPGLSPCPTPPPGTDGAVGWVQVNDSTATPGGGNEVDFFLAPVLNVAFDGGTVHAKAVAAWGPMGSGAAVPFVFSLCEWIALGGDVEGGTVPSGTRVIYFHGRDRNDPRASSCRPNPSGQDLPGGFGRVDSPDCVRALTVGEWAPVDTGDDMVRGCPYQSWRDADIVIAIYDEVRGTGNNGEYHIKAFAGFHVQGYRFNGNRLYETAACPRINPASVTYLCGYFTYVGSNQGGFGGPDFGARVITMIG